MKLYKLTRQDGTAYGGTQWSEGVTIKTSGRGRLCGPGYTHWYTHPLLAVLLNPIHAYYTDPVLWEGEGEAVKSDGLQVGCKKATTIRRIPLPKVTTEQRVKFAILCALQVYREPGYVAWAESWLSGADRSLESAQAARLKTPQVPGLAARAAREAARTAEYAAKGEEGSAALSAEYAALSTHNSALAAEYAAQAADYAELAAEWMTDEKARANKARPFLDLAGLAEQACS